MEDFFVLFKSEEYFIYRPAKIKMHAEAFDAWREVAEKAELVVKRVTNIFWLGTYSKYVPILVRK